MELQRIEFDAHWGENIEEYASTETRTKGEQLIQEELINISNMDIRKKTEEFLSSEFKGRRDFRF